MRIVSLSPALTELCFDLGRGDDLVGVDDASDTPPAVDGLPRLGSVMEPDLEALEGLRPDLVLVFDLVPGRVGIPDRLLESGPGVEVLGAERLADVYLLFERLGELLERPDAGVRAARDLEARLAAVRRRLSPLEPRPRVHVELWPKPPLALGRRSWIHDLLALAGGDNVFADVDAPNVEVDAAAVAHRAPDLMLVTWGNLATPLAPVLKRDGWQQVDAVRRRRVATVAVDSLKRPVTRLYRGFEVLAGALRQEMAGDAAPLA